MQAHGDIDCDLVWHPKDVVVRRLQRRAHGDLYAAIRALGTIETRFPLRPGIGGTDKQQHQAAEQTHWIFALHSTILFPAAKGYSRTASLFEIHEFPVNPARRAVDIT